MTVFLKFIHVVSLTHLSFNYTKILHLVMPPPQSTKKTKEKLNELARRKFTITVPRSTKLIRKPYSTFACYLKLNYFYNTSHTRWWQVILKFPNVCVKVGRNASRSGAELGDSPRRPDFITVLLTGKFIPL